MKTLYMECLSGISGDMFVASMLDLGADQTVLINVLNSIPVQGFRIGISRVKKSGLDVCDFDVILDHELDNHDHDMEYLHGHEHGQSHDDEQSHHDEHSHNHEHLHAAHDDEHSHDHTHSHEHAKHKNEHTHEHVHRGLADVLDIIERTQMTENAKNIAKKVFTILGKAEAKAHGTTLEEVHFHEVGAIDSIVDIISAAVCVDNLGIEEVIIPSLSEGCGTVRCAHGILPVPVPAVSNIITENGLNIKITSVEGELVTPTGAAIAAALRTSSKLPEEFTIKKIGMGAGKREYERPSILRAMLIHCTNATQDAETVQDAGPVEADMIYKLESNIDDCTGENFGYVLDRLIEAGARDVHYMPVFMKKNRPAYQLNVICTKEDIKKLENIIFEETTTIGIRRIAMERTILKREIEQFETSLGYADVKVCEHNGEVRIYPEYNSVAALCATSGLSYSEVFRLVEREADEKLQR